MTGGGGVFIEKGAWEIVKLDGSISQDKEGVIGHWGEQFENLFNPPSQHDVTQNGEVDSDGQQELIDTSTGQNNLISIEEVRAALRKVKSGKCCGFDGIPVETLQTETAITFLHKLLHNCFE